MCHHYRAAPIVPEHFVAEFSLRANQRLLIKELAWELKNAGAYPLKTVPAIRVDGAGELEAFGAEWGLLPRWWKPSDRTPKRQAFQRKTFNARSETAHEKPTFRDAWRRRRCLLPFDQFFEKGHYFGVGEPISFAGLWETWQGEDGELTTATLLTTEPNTEVRAVGHNRMPCLLTTPDERRAWLAGEESLALDPFADGRLQTEPATES